MLFIANSFLTMKLINSYNPNIYRKAVLAYKAFLENARTTMVKHLQQHHIHSQHQLTEVIRRYTQQFLPVLRSSVTVLLEQRTRTKPTETQLQAFLFQSLWNAVLNDRSISRLITKNRQKIQENNDISKI